jgi:hypothetical protein
MLFIVRKTQFGYTNIKFLYILKIILYIINIDNFIYRDIVCNDFFRDASKYCRNIIWNCQNQN